MSRLDISGVGQVPLHTDYDVLEIWKTDGGQDIVREALFEQNRRVGGEFRDYGKCCGKSGGIIVPSRMRDNIIGPSQNKRSGR